MAGYRQLPQALDSPTATVFIDALSGGMNTKVHPTRLNPDEAPLIQNMRIKKGAFAEKRGGIRDTTVASGVKYTPTLPTYGLGNLKPNTATLTDKMIASIGIGGTTVGSSNTSGYHHWNGSDGTGWVELTLPADAAGDGAVGNRVQFVQVRDTNAVTKDQVYIFEEGCEDVFSYDGTGTLGRVSGGSNGAADSVPLGKDATYWLSRLWIAGAGDEDGFIYYSNAGEPNKVDKTRGFLINPNDDMMRIIPFMQNGIICFMRESIWLLDIDQANFSDPLYDATSIMPLNNDIGTVAPRSVAQAGHDFFFLSRHGIHRLSKTTRDRPLGVTDPLSNKIQGTIDRIHWEYAEDSVGVVWDNLYLLAVPLDGSTTNNAILVYDMLEDAWSIFTGWAVGDFTISKVDGTESLFFGDVANGKVFETFATGVNTDDGVDIESIVETPRFSFGGTNFQKHYQYIDVYAQGATGGVIELFVAPDEGTLTKYGEMIVTDGAPVLDDNNPLLLPFELTDGGLNRTRFYLDSFGAVREMQFKFRTSGRNRAKILYYSVTALPEQENLD